MKKPKNDFKIKNNQDYYDIIDDWPLIEASFFKQYGIRLRQINDMPWDEFCSYLSGIMPDTPLGNVVQIRSEEDKEILKNFTPEQKRIRSEWRNRMAKNMDKKQAEDAIEMFKNMFRELAGGDAKVK
ncbi:Gp15 family bacteriophage protein [Thomasclavelia spiroformis]|uniref:Gp15 family bacteriophage protein n=1 Tax=Thomasclavelia spiroformis TaxID=29348 RepID=UPI0026DAA0A3|nr:Gp15 family bacteriophage protein [Thomasclavelia spiroformis]